ncbi:MAG TPA: plastocyanin/azurin family copper-binding protein [Candidatus Limnocylindria bacterium]|nr:plastocyanin/azurin family copper-binding protein [Candidatus Limnocylindria bacterium]
MIRRALIAALVALVLSTSGVAAATTVIDAHDFTFTPNAPKLAVGDTAQWHNSSFNVHDMTPNAPSVWPASGGTMQAGKSMAMAMTHAGSYPYRCVIHSGQNMEGTVKVKMSSSPTSGTTSTNFNIRVATVNAGPSRTQDVQRRKHNGTWKAWLSTTSQLVIFNPASSETGTWEFRSRYHNTSNGEMTGWSPTLTIVVN